MALVGTWREQGRGRRGCRTRGGRAQNARASCAAGAGVVREPRHFCLFLFRLFSCWLAVARCGVVACVSACCSMRARVPACVHAAACLLVHVHPSPCDHHTHNHWTQQSKVRGQRQQRAGGDTRRPVHARLHTSDGRCPSRVYALFSTPYSLHPFPPSPTLDPPPQNALSHPRPSPAPETLSVSSVCARTRSHSLTHSLVHTHTHTHIHTHTHTHSKCMGATTCGGTAVERRSRQHRQRQTRTRKRTRRPHATQQTLQFLRTSGTSQPRWLQRQGAGLAVHSGKRGELVEHSTLLRHARLPLPAACWYVLAQADALTWCGPAGRASAVSLLVQKPPACTRLPARQHACTKHAQMPHSAARTHAPLSVYVPPCTCMRVRLLTLCPAPTDPVGQIWPRGTGSVGDSVGEG